MSESKEDTTSSFKASAATASASDSDALWSKLYNQACSLLATTQDKLGEGENKVEDNECASLHQRIVITLDTITKLIFGVEGTKKAQIVVHGNGTIELIIGLVRSSQVLRDVYKTPLSKPIVLSSLKALKTCVLRNPAGRCRCRTAGAFLFLKDILNMIQSNEKDTKKQDAENKLLVEHLYTTLAAICLGDDLNAFQASTQFRPLMEKTKQLYCSQGDENGSQLNQKIQYLESLFEAVEKEQSVLLTYFATKGNSKEEKEIYQEFIENVNKAESNIRKGYEQVRAQNYKEAKNYYNESLELISDYLEYTQLFHPLMIEIRTKRGQACLGMKEFEACLADTVYLLEQERLGEASMAKTTVLKLHSKALINLGRNDEAKESLGKLAILCPGDDEVVTLLNSLKL